MFKKGVKIAGVKPEMAFAQAEIREVCAELRIPFVITSCREGKHGQRSLHYSGYAIDVRTNTLPEVMHRVFRDKVAARLTDEFDVVLEKTHLHVEFDPKTTHVPMQVR